MVVIPSNGGSDRTPAWWLNLRASGEGWVIDGRRRFKVRPRVAEGDEREDLWRRFVEFNPLSEQYQSLARRQPPIVVLEEVAED
jgi:deazaflavin-dependent oxidoreductase (nitroreductase family)